MFPSLARIAHMYYNEGLTQQEIASRLQMSRIKISRLLRQAREQGIVKIEIKYNGFFPELEQALTSAYGIQFIIADSVSSDPADLLDSLGAVAADYLESMLSEQKVVAVGWGQTLRAVSSHLSAEAPNTTFVPLVGGQANAGLDIHANSIAAQMASRTGGKAEALFAPAVADSIHSRDMLLESRPINRVLSMAANAPVCLFGVGAPFSPASSIKSVGYYSPTDINTLRQEGAACDILSTAYYSVAGEQCAQSISSRTLSLSEDQLRKIPHKICVAGGSGKHEAIKIALDLHSIIDVMILDDISARYLLANCAKS